MNFTEQLTDLQQRLRFLEEQLRVTEVRGGGGLATKGFRFGIKTLSGAQVTILPGAVAIGILPPIVTAETEVTIAGGTLASPHWIMVKHVWGSSTAAVQVSTSYPATNATALNWPLYAVYLAGGRATLVREGGIAHVGDIILPGNYGA